MKLYLALDIGTSSTKASLYRENGVCISSASAGYELHYPKAGWAEQNPLDWWQAVQLTCRQVLQGVDCQALRSVCVSGQAPSCVPVDRLGQPLRPAILWLDRRAAEEALWLRDLLADMPLEQESGNVLDSYYGGVKWAWFLRHEPELYAQTWKILQASSFVLLRLSGEAVVDHSQAGLCSPCYHLPQRVWNARVCERMGLDSARLPALRASSQVAGQVTRQASEATGIPVNTPLVCGGGDFACACLGAGVLQPGSAAMMLGTAGNLLAPAPRRTDWRLFNTVHVTGESLSLGGVLAGGAVRWFLEMLGGPADSLLATLESEAQAIPPGAEGLLFLPYLLGERTPIWDPHARGAFLGLSTRHGRGHLYRAVLEGVALAYRQMAEIFKEMDSPIREVIAINGGARSPLWRQIFADVLQVPVRWRPESGGTALGAAFLAAWGVGDFRSPADLGAWLEPTVDMLPNPAHAPIYDRLFAIFSPLYERLKDSLHALAEEGKAG